MKYLLILFFLLQGCNFLGKTSLDIAFFGGTSTQKAPPDLRFISTWRVGDVGFGDGDNSITLPLRTGYSYNFTVDWGDGTSSEITTFDDVDITHNYALADDYIVTIEGLADAWYFNNSGDKDKIIHIKSIGDLKKVATDNYEIFSSEARKLRIYIQYENINKIPKIIKNVVVNDMSFSLNTFHFFKVRKDYYISEVNYCKTPFSLFSKKRCLYKGNVL